METGSERTEEIQPKRPNRQVRRVKINLCNAGPLQPRPILVRRLRWANCRTMQDPGHAAINLNKGAAEAVVAVGELEAGQALVAPHAAEKT
jgi:hypothetical protein